MPDDLEQELHHRLHAESAGFELAPSVAEAVTQEGRRRLRGRRAAAVGGIVVVVAAASVVAATSWYNRPPELSVVAMDPAPPPTQSGISSAPQTSSDTSSAPRLITRDADDDFPGLYAYLPGTLVVTSTDCIAVAAREDERPIGIVWGHGWSAGWQNGKAVVYDATGAVFAREGDRIGLGGGAADGGGQYAGNPCATSPIFIANDAQSAPLPTTDP